MIIERTFLKTNIYTNPTLSYIITNNNRCYNSITNMFDKILIDRYNIVIESNYDYINQINKRLHEKKKYNIIFDKLEMERPNYIIYKVFKQSNQIVYFETLSIDKYRI